MHKSYFFLANRHTRHVVQLLNKQLVEPRRINRTIPVEESVFHFRTRISLQHVVLTTECVGIVIS